MTDTVTFGGQVRQSYGLTATENNVIHYLGCGGAIISIVLCFGVYSSALWVRSYKQSRQTLDRVSFRLLMWALSSEFLYSFFYLGIFIVPSAYKPGGKLGPATCRNAIYFLVSTMGAVNYLTTCIAINLMLTICFGLNPLRLRLERWYIGGSFALAYLIPIPSAALRHFGYDEKIGTCWISTPDVTKRFIWSILAIYLWQMLATLISLVCVIFTLIVLFRQARATKKAMRAGSDLNRAIYTKGDGLDSQTFPGLAAPFPIGALSQIHEESEDTQSPALSSGIGQATQRHVLAQPLGVYRQWRKNSKASAAAKRAAKDSTMNSLSDRFAGIAMRVAAYPLVLIVINAVLTTGDLVLASRGGVDSRGTLALYCIFTLFYGGRGVFFAGLVIFVDPCLTRGVKAALAERKAARNPEVGKLEQGIDTNTPMLAYTESTPIESADAGGSTKPDFELASTHLRTRSGTTGTSFDLAAALSHLPSPSTADAELKIVFPIASSSKHNLYDAGDRHSHRASSSVVHSPAASTHTVERYPPRVDPLGDRPQVGVGESYMIHADFASLARIPTRPEYDERRWSRAFVGVEEGALPPGLTDEVDVIYPRRKSTRPDLFRNATGLPLARQNTRGTVSANSTERRASDSVRWVNALSGLMMPPQDEESRIGPEESEEEKQRALEEEGKRLDAIEGHL